MPESLIPVTDAEEFIRSYPLPGPGRDLTEWRAVMADAFRAWALNPANFPGRDR